MKVGTDGVLLGAWCRVDPGAVKALLDVGTGTGVIALQLAQRTEGPGAGSGSGSRSSSGVGAIVEAVEIDPVAAAQAGRNFEASPWANRLKINAMSLQDFAADPLHRGRFDHIVSNPPYFTDSLASPDPARHTARHADTLPYREFISLCDRLLGPTGRVSVILPAGVETERMIALATGSDEVLGASSDAYSRARFDDTKMEADACVHMDTCVGAGAKAIACECVQLDTCLGFGVDECVQMDTSARGEDFYEKQANTEGSFFLTRRTDVHTTLTSGVKRCLLEFSRLRQEPVEVSKLVIQDDGPGTFSAEYRALTRDFYLKF